jgi:hypothetical protein
MRLFVTLCFLVVGSASFAATNEYTVTLLKPDLLAELSRPEHQASTNLVGKSITAIYGPIAEVRITLRPINRTGIEEDAKKVEERIRQRIDTAKCLGRDREVAWNGAPWLNGHVLLKDGRILPIEIFLSGIVVGDLLFSEQAESGRRED